MKNFLKEFLVPSAFVLGWGSAQLDRADYSNLVFGLAWMLPLLVVGAVMRYRRSSVA